MSQTVIISLGNAGFQVLHNNRSILVDPYFWQLPGITSSKWKGSRELDPIHLILITHDHWDHLRVRELTLAAKRTGAKVLGPRSVTRQLGDRLPAEALIEVEPPDSSAPVRTPVDGVTVTTLRTHHGQAHNSYLVEQPGFRFFHDGDNEHTQRLDATRLRDLDALMICPWQGSGWVKFIEAVQPRRWFLMHMTDEELDQHARGAFFPDLCDHVPLADRLVALRPGDRFQYE